MSRQILASVLLLIGCDQGRAETDPGSDACRATYARLEALGCEQNMRALLARGCFESGLEPADCDLSVLDPCTEEIEKFEKVPGGWSDPLDTFLERKCGPPGTKAIEWPKPDREALAATAKLKTLVAEAEVHVEVLAAEIDAREEELQRVVEGARIKVTKVDVQGALSKTQISKVVDAENAALRECYLIGLILIPELAGKITVNFVITGTGRVGSSVVQSSDLENQAVSYCVARTIKGWTFPTPRGGGNVIATISFDLSND